MSKHPAVKFGGWLKARRQEHGIVARVFAGKIGLSPAEYAEVEAGIVQWIGVRQTLLIGNILGLSEAERNLMDADLGNAKSEKALQFKDLFNREQLEPMRASEKDGKQITEAMKKDILNAVFSPLASAPYSPMI